MTGSIAGFQGHVTVNAAESHGRYAGPEDFRGLMYFTLENGIEEAGLAVKDRMRVPASGSRREDTAINCHHSLDEPPYPGGGLGVSYDGL